MLELVIVNQTEDPTNLAMTNQATIHTSNAIHPISNRNVGVVDRANVSHELRTPR